MRISIERAKDLWDKLDPPDRDIIFKSSHNAMFEVDTLCDWRALSEEEQENIIRWFSSK